mmetsp:Transcript_9105/g.16684  ORF Transcript_9105/g.16684 Transcript_9105/m.16684 type:complete len:212 (+) Transcript_9105:964-1599(+)
MQHSIPLGMEHREAFRAHQLLSLFRKYCCPDILALVAHGNHGHLGCCVLPSMAIEVAFPKALNAVIVQAIVTCKGSRAIFAFLTPLLGLNHITVRHAHKHGLVLQSVSTSVHVFETLEAEVVLAVGTEDLWLLHRASRAQAPTCCGQEGVVLPRTQCILVQGICTRLAEGHKALVALQGRLHHPAGLAWNLQVAKLLVEEHVWLGEQKPIY